MDAIVDGLFKELYNVEGYIGEVSGVLLAFLFVRVSSRSDDNKTWHGAIKYKYENVCGR